MNKLNTSKVTSLDGISARLSREYAVLTRDTLNYTIRQSKLPGDWESATVTPLFKEGDQDNVENYRLISVISVVVKVLERIVYELLYAY